MNYRLMVMQALVERTALMASVKAWREDLDAPRILVLIGSPGSGKTTFCEGLTATGDLPIHAAHFCRANDASTTSPLALITAMAARLSRAVPGFSEKLLEDVSGRSTIHVHIEASSVQGTVVGTQIEVLNLQEQSLRDALWISLIRPLTALAQDGAQAPVTLLVDGLDEAGDDAENLADLIGQLSSLPPFVRIIASSRPDGRVLRSLPDNFRRCFSLDDDYPSDLRESELREVVRRIITQDKSQQQPGVEAMAADLARRAAGNFQFAAVLASFARQDPDAFRRGDVPRELNVLYARYLHKLEPDPRAWRRNYGPLLGLLSVALRPLSEEQLAQYSGLRRSEARASLDALSPFLRRHANSFAIYHASFSDYIRSEASGIYWSPPEESHEAFLKLVRTEHELEWERSDEYILKFGPVHLIEAHLSPEFVEKGLDLGLYKAKLARQQLGDVVDDYRRYVRTLRSAGNILLVWRLGWAAALAREASRAGTATMLSAYVKTGRWPRAVELALALDEQSGGYHSERMTALTEIAIELGTLGDSQSALEVLQLIDEKRRPWAAARTAEQLAAVQPEKAVELLQKAGYNRATARTCALLAAYPSHRADAIRLAAHCNEEVWATAVVLWPDDPTVTELVRHSVWQQSIAGNKHDWSGDHLPRLAAVELSRTDPVRASRILESIEPSDSHDDLWQMAAAVIAGRLFPLDAQRALRLLERIEHGSHRVLLKAQFCAAGGAAAFPMLSQVSEPEQRWAEVWCWRPECLDLAGQIDLDTLAGDPDARRLSAWCLERVLSWLNERSDEDRIDYRSELFALIGRWIGLTAPERFAEFRAWAEDKDTFHRSYADKGFLTGLAEASGAAGVVGWLEANPSLEDEQSLREAVAVVARRQPAEVLAFINSIARYEAQALTLRGAAAKALPGECLTELKALLQQLPSHKHSRRYQVLCSMIRALAAVSSAPAAPVLSGSDVDLLPEALRDWLRFICAASDPPAAPYDAALKAANGLVRSELMHRAAVGPDARERLVEAARTCHLVAEYGILVDGIGWLHKDEVFASIVRDAAQIDPPLAVELAALEPENGRAVEIAVSGWLAADPTTHPADLVLRLLHLLPKRSGETLAELAVSYRSRVTIVRAVARHTERLDDLVAWVENANPILAHDLRCRYSRESPSILVDAARLKLNERRAGAGSEHGLEQVQLKDAFLAALSRFAAEDFDAAVYLWKAELAGSRRREAFVQLASSAAEAGCPCERAMLLHHFSGDRDAPGTVNDALRHIAVSQGRSDYRQGLQRVAEIADDESLAGIALREVVGTRRMVGSRTSDELLAMLDAAEALPDEQHRIEVIQECLFDDGGAWNREIAELCLVRAVEASLERWHQILPALTRRLAMHAPDFVLGLEKEMPLIDQIASVVVA